MLFVCVLHQCSSFYTFHRLELNAVALMVRMPIKKKKTKNPKPSKQTKANLLGSFEYCNGNWISVTGWLVTVQRVMGVFVAQVLAMTSSWIEWGSWNRWSALFLCPAGLWSHTSPSAHAWFISIIYVKLCAKHLLTISFIWGGLSYVNFFICQHGLYWLFTRTLFIRNLFMYNFHQFHIRNSPCLFLAIFSIQKVNQPQK